MISVQKSAFSGRLIAGLTGRCLPCHKGVLGEYCQTCSLQGQKERHRINVWANFEWMPGNYSLVNRISKEKNELEIILDEVVWKELGCGACTVLLLSEEMDSQVWAQLAVCPDWIFWVLGDGGWWSCLRAHCGAFTKVQESSPTWRLPFRRSRVGPCGSQHPPLRLLLFHGVPLKEFLYSTSHPKVHGDLSPCGLRGEGHPISSLWLGSSHSVSWDIRSGGFAKEQVLVYQEATTQQEKSPHEDIVFMA